MKGFVLWLVSFLASCGISSVYIFILDIGLGLLVILAALTTLAVTLMICLAGDTFFS